MWVHEVNVMVPFLENWQVTNNSKLNCMYCINGTRLSNNKKYSIVLLAFYQCLIDILHKFMTIIINLSSTNTWNRRLPQCVKNKKSIINFVTCTSTMVDTIKYFPVWSFNNIPKPLRIFIISCEREINSPIMAHSEFPLEFFCYP